MLVSVMWKLFAQCALPTLRQGGAVCCLCAMAQARKCLHKEFVQTFNKNSSHWTPYAHANGPSLSKEEAWPPWPMDPLLERRITAWAIDKGGGG